MSARFRFGVLNGIRLEGPDGPLSGAAVQRRRLAVLSLIAGNSMSRDRIVAFLWPESSEERARHAFAQVLYSLRREFGEDVVLGSPTALSLNGAVISSDIEDLNAAHARGDLLQAAQLYTGPFLDGFHLGGCAEYDHWIEQERMRLAQRAHAAFESVAEQAAAAGDLAGAAGWWHRLANATPFDSRVALKLAQALATAGDRARAIRYLRAHDALLQNELGTHADPALIAFAEELAAQPEPARGSPPASANRPAARAATPVDAADLALTAAVPAPVLAPATNAMSRRWYWLRFAIPSVAVAALVLGLATRPDPGPREWIIVADVENRTGDSIFEPTVSFALAAALRQSTQVNVLPPERIREVLVRMRRPGADTALDLSLAREIAQREGARVVLVPSLTRLDSVYTLTVRFIEPDSGGLLEVIEERARSRDGVIDALDDVARRARQALGESMFSVATRTVPLPRMSTASLDALRRYSQGRRAWGRNQLNEARLLFEQAIVADTSFAAAYSALGALEYYMNRPRAGDDWFKHALAHLDALPERDRTMIRAEMHSWQGDRDAAVALLRSFLLSQPNDLDATRQLGYELMRLNRDSQAIDVLRRLVQLDSGDVRSLINLAVAEKGLARWTDAIAHYRRAIALVPELELANNNFNLEYGGTYVNAGDLEAAERVFRKLLNVGPGERARGLRSLAFLSMKRGRFAQASEELGEALTLTRAVRQPTSEIRNRLLIVSVAELLGRNELATEQRDSAFALASRSDIESTLLYWTGKTLARAGDVTRTAAVLKKLEAGVHEGSRPDLAAVEALRGELLVAQGKTTEAVGHVERARLADEGNVVLESTAFVLARAGTLERAIPLYELLAGRNQFGAEGQISGITAYYHLGRAHEQRNDRARAVAAYQRFLQSPGISQSGIWPVADAQSRLTRLSADQPSPRR